MHKAAPSMSISLISFPFKMALHTKTLYHAAIFSLSSKPSCSVDANQQKLVTVRSYTEN